MTAKTIYNLTILTSVNIIIYSNIEFQKNQQGDPRSISYKPSHNNGYGYMHKDNGNNIVSWESGAANSQWTPIEVSYTDEQLAAVWAEVESLVVPSTTVDTYEGYLDVLFSDKSCVTPKLATLDAAKATDAYNNLPVTLQKMVDKVLNLIEIQQFCYTDSKENHTFCTAALTCLGIF